MSVPNLARDPAGANKSVLLLATHSSLGGVREIMTDLAHGFIDRGFQVSLCALYPGQEGIALNGDRLTWEHISDKKPNSLIGMARLFSKLLSYFFRKRPDFVISAMPAANIFGPIASALVGLRPVFIISHHVPVNTYSTVLNRLDSIIGSSFAVTHIVSVSESVSKSQDYKLIKYKNKRKTITNALPTDIEEYISFLRLSASSSREARRIVATGRLVAQKNYPVLVRMSAHLPDVELCIVGSGPDENLLREMALTLGVSDRIKFMGQMSRKQALGVLATSSIFMQPSFFEGHSLGLLEAAKLGLPLIVSNVPVQIEGISDPDGYLCGIAVDPDDHIAFAEAVSLLLSNDNYYNNLSKDSLRLSTSITYEKMINKYIHLMEI